MWERERQEEYRRRCDAEWAKVFQAVADARPAPVTLQGAEQRFADRGHQQLLRLDPEQLAVLGQATHFGVAAVNRALRSGTGLDNGPSADLDWAGYRSNRAAAEAWRALFKTLGDDLRLDPAIVAYRGIRVPSDSQLVRFARMASAGQVYTDDGFMFATFDEEDASFYAGAFTEGPHWNHAGVEDQPMLLRLHIREGICLPPDEWRSPVLAAHLATARRQGVRDTDVIPEYGEKVRTDRMGWRSAIERAPGQVVIDAGSRWRLICASTPAMSPSSMWELELEQLPSPPPASPTSI